MKVKLHDMTWPEVEEVLKKPNVVIVPTGSTEQHGPNRVFYHSRKKYPVRAKGDSGVMGDATVASRETGEKIVSAVVDDLAEIIVQVVQSEQG